MTPKFLNAYGYQLMNSLKEIKQKPEKTYSEEEVLKLLYKLWEANPRNIKEWFEQFKKK